MKYKRMEFGIIAIVAFAAACYAPLPQLVAVLLGLLSGIAVGYALLWRDRP